LKVAELHATPEVIGSLEIRSNITDFQHRWTSSQTLEQMTDHSRE